MRLCSVNVDLDEIPNYLQIHGIGDGPDEIARTAVYDVAVARLMTMASAANLPLTLFAVGSDLARVEAAKSLRDAQSKGHEIANHSLDHRYDLVRLPTDERLRQIEAGSRAIEKAVGVKPRGFRAPGYTITDAVFSQLADLAVAYDSSIFPCPPYYFAKAFTIGRMKLVGRTSRSLIDSPHVLRAPTRPYRIGKPYYRRGNGMVELPIQVTPGLRLPVIGTTLTMAGPNMAKSLTRACIGEPFINLELHGIDVLDAADGLEMLRPYQPDVRIEKKRKLESLHAAFDLIRSAGYSFVTLEEAASQPALVDRRD